MTYTATEWAVLDVLYRHRYEISDRGNKPDDPGWHVCSCGWQGYWCDWQPHVARCVVDALNPATDSVVKAVG